MPLGARSALYAFRLLEVPDVICARVLEAIGALCVVKESLQRTNVSL